MQLPDESQAQSTECPEQVRAVDWTRLLCIQTWCLWWFVDETNVDCLFDLHVCYMCVLCFVRFAEEAENRRNVRLAKLHIETKHAMTATISRTVYQTLTQLGEEARLFNIQ